MRVSGDGGGRFRLARREPCISLLLPGLATPPDACRISETLFSLEVKHGVPEKPIRLGLVATAIGFEPVDDVGIQPHGDGPLCRSIELPYFGSAPIKDRRRIRKIKVFVSFCGDGSDVSLLRLRELPHRLSFRATRRREPR